MKTAIQIQKEIDRILAWQRGKSFTGGPAAKANRKRPAFLKPCLAYLQTGPSRDFVAKQLGQAMAKLNRIEAEAEASYDHIKNLEIKKRLVNKYISDNGKSKLLKQISTLNYILQ